MSSIHAFPGKHKQALFEGLCTMKTIEFSLSMKSCNLRAGFCQGAVKVELVTDSSAQKLNSAVSNNMCPVGDSADVEGDGLSEIWKGHCMEEGSGCRLVRSAEERGLLALPCCSGGKVLLSI